MRFLGVASTLGVVGLAMLALAPACNEPEPAEPAASERAEPTPTPTVVDQFVKARRDTMCVDAQMLAGAVEMHLLMDPGRCPADVGALVSAKTIQRVPNSAAHWSITCNDAEVIVRAAGEDGRLDTDDDVVFGGPRANCTAD